MTSTPALVARLRAAGCVFAEEEGQLLTEAAGDPAELERLTALRCDGLPLEQVLGWTDFCGLRILVAPGVFVPRRRSELLAQAAIELLRTVPGRPVVVDLCCGSAALGTAVASAAAVELHVADLDAAAVACARRNVAPLGGHAYAGDLFDALPDRLRGGVDVLVANAPYVPTEAIATMPPEARLHEPAHALDGGADGLDVQRRVIAAAPEWLAPGGHLLVETGEPQVTATCAAFEAAGLAPRVLRSAELDATAVAGCAS